MYCTSAGRAYLAALPEHEADAILVASERKGYTPNTVTDLDQLRAIVAEARHDGYAYALEEYYAGDISVAAAMDRAVLITLGASCFRASSRFQRLNGTEMFTAPSG